MVDKKKDDKSSLPSGDKKVTAEDLEKTILDVNVRDLDKVVEETVLYKRPTGAQEEEDTNLHGKEKKSEESPLEAQKKGAAPLKTEATPPKDPSSKKEKIPESVKGPSKRSSEEVAPPSKREREKITPVEAGPPIPQWVKILEFVIGLFLLLILLDAGIEGLAVGSPLSGTIFGVLILCLAVNVIFIFRRGNFHVGVETTACVLILLVGYATWRYGSIDAGAFSLLKHPPAALFNFIFLAIYLFSLGALLLQKGRSLLVRLVLSILVIYGIAGIVENLLQGILHSQAWNLEDTLLGTQLWKWVPLYYLRPTLFSFWILIPLLIFTFLFSGGAKAEGSSRGRLGQHGFMVLLLLLAFFLGSVILQNSRIPNFLSLLMTPSLGVGQTKAANAVGGPLNYNIEVATYNVALEKTNDQTQLYRMAAYFSPSPDGKKAISLNVRGAGGHVVPFLNAKDLLVIQDEAPQKPVRIRFKADELLPSKDLEVLVDRSASMALHFWAL
jgi:hypothetical protein